VTLETMPLADTVCVTNVVAESNFVALEIPRAAIFAFQYVRVRAAPLVETASDGACLCCLPMSIISTDL
jgi:hypothetical protein